MSDQKSADIIQRALKLDGSSEKIQDFYAEWSDQYDHDVASENYTGPKVMADLVAELGQFTGAPVKVLDAGCGTGLVAEFLLAIGITQPDGFDISEEMVDLAQQKGLYADLKGGVDINRLQEWYPEPVYDLVICCGVFTSGHVGPEAVLKLVEVSKRGAIIIVNTRLAYSESTGFPEEIDLLQAEGRVRLVEQRKNLPYTDDSRAHYWILEVL